MGMIASYKMVDPDVIDRLLQLDHEDLSEELSEINEDPRYETIDIDKSWDGLHFLLTGKSAVVPMKENLLSESIVGSHLFSEDEDNDFVAYTCFEELEAIISAFKNVNKRTLYKRFSPDLFTKSRIYPDIWNTKNKAELFEFLYETGYKKLLKFYRSALKHKKCVIVTIQ